MFFYAAIMRDFFTIQLMFNSRLIGYISTLNVRVCVEVFLRDAFIYTASIYCMGWLYN